jgi:hypothetical protein
VANGIDSSAAAVAGGAGETAEEIEARARVTGWRPREEYRGPPGNFVEADEYLRRAENDLPLLRTRLRSMNGHIEKLTRENATAVTLLEDMGERVRKTEEIAYKRARADLERERDAAVESGDIAAFKDADRRLREAEREAPRPAPTKPAVSTQAAAPAPEVIEWAQRNPWFNTDPVMAQAATEISNRLQAAEPELSIEENLERTTAGVRAMFPSKFRGQRAGSAAAAEGEEAGAQAEGNQPRAANPRRTAAAAVGNAAPAPGARGSGPRRDFASMPQEVKDQFHRYKRMIDAKAGTKPLSEAEWASSYWAQFD